MNGKRFHILWSLKRVFGICLDALLELASGKRNASSQAALASSLKRRIKESLALRATAFAVVEADLQEAAVASGAVSSTLLPRWLQSLTCCAYISKLYPKVSFHHILIFENSNPNFFCTSLRAFLLNTDRIQRFRDKYKSLLHLRWDMLFMCGYIHLCVSGISID